MGSCCSGKKKGRPRDEAGLKQTECRRVITPLAPATIDDCGIENRGSRRLMPRIQSGPPRADIDSIPSTSACRCPSSIHARDEACSNSTRTDVQRTSCPDHMIERNVDGRPLSAFEASSTSGRSASAAVASLLQYFSNAPTRSAAIALALRPSMCRRSIT